MKIQPALKTRIIIFLCSICMALLLTGCITPTQQHKKYISRILADEGIKTEKQLYNFFMDSKPNADKELVQRLTHYYVTEAKAEGINSDCAFVQMCLETGWLTFGNLVTKDMHNYCGLGAIDKNHPGESFETEQMGVRAHIQHLHAYATTSDIKLKNKLIDNRYKYVLPRGKAPTIYGLAGTWAADKEYGKKLDSLLSKLENY